MARVGLYGGSFNPIHVGHLRSAVEVRARARLAEVWLLPAHQPPHKDTAEIAPASDRLAMLQLGLGDTPGLRAEPIELERKGPSYSIDTLRLLRERHPDQTFAWVLGFDAFLELHAWHQYDRFVTECDLVVTTRPPHPVTTGANLDRFGELPIAVRRGFWYEPAIGCYVNESGRRLEFLPVTQLDISASALRAAIAQGASIRYLVPESVRAYLIEHRLYQPHG